VRVGSGEVGARAKKKKKKKKAPEGQPEIWTLPEGRRQVF
jgi:hypothetical protein